MDNEDNTIDAFNRIYEFNRNTNLASEIAKLENALRFKQPSLVSEVIGLNSTGIDFVNSASIVKKAISQIDVIIHAYGILNLLPIILEHDEVIEYLSLGAGNTGKNFDLETNKRIAAFKFINWSGSHDTIRQNTTFKDLFSLAECSTNKQRFLYVLNKGFVLKFLLNNRAIKSVLNKTAYEKFIQIHGSKYKTVSEYYNDKKHLVQIVDIKDIYPELIF